jgi:hypothetical protein
MKSVAALLVTAIVIAVVGGLLWFAGSAEQEVAAAEYTLVTLRYERAADELAAASDRGLLEPVLRRLSPGADVEHALARYWSGDYDALAAERELTMQVLAANAEYRALRTAGGPWQAVVSRLDTIAKRYADILRTNPEGEDAAYNYEFIVKLRAAVMKVRQPVPGGDPAAATLTVHGEPGAPPQDSDAKKFRMIVPMLPDERQEAEEAGRAGRKMRKG